MLYDRAHIGSARITKEGYLVADALVARANNVQQYRASELGLEDRDPNDVIRVFRPEKVVFAADTLRSASRLPVTLDHPSVMVDAKNWREYAKGETGEEIMRDGEFMRVPLRVTDAAAVDSVRADRQEFSLGYAATFDFSPGEFEGQAYDAALTSITYNHLAACRAARGGSELRIVDERTTGDTRMKIRIGDAEVDATNGEAVRIANDAREAKLADATARLTAADARIVEHEASIVAKDAEIAKLTAELADERDPAKRQARDAARAVVVDKAKALGIAVADGTDTAAIMKSVVDKAMGDKAKGYTADHIAIAFEALTKDVKPADPIADAFRGGIKTIGDAAADIRTARAAWLAGKSGAYRNHAA